MKRLFIVAALLISIGTAVAQEEVAFTADRPGASTGPGVVGRNVVQLEQGIQYDGDGGAGTITITFCNTLLRYGLFDGMELRLGGDAFLYRPQEQLSGYKAAFLIQRQAVSM